MQTFAVIFEERARVKKRVDWISLNVVFLFTISSVNLMSPEQSRSTSKQKRSKQSEKKETRKANNGFYDTL